MALCRTRSYTYFSSSSSSSSSSYSFPPLLQLPFTSPLPVCLPSRNCLGFHSWALGNCPLSFPYGNATILSGSKGLRIPRDDALFGRNGAVICFSFRSLGWNAEESPYDMLGVEKHVTEEEIKIAYRQMAKQFHPDGVNLNAILTEIAPYILLVYDGNGVLQGGETAEQRFIKIQAAYELLIDKEKRMEYDADHCNNPLKASKAWMEWVVKKKKAYEQRGEMAVTLWAEQQQREMSLKARRLSRFKVDPEEERKILAKEKQSAVENFEITLKRHTLVLKKRDILRKKAESAVKKKLVQQLLAEEGLELDDERF
ncbi:hypothetical protein O6H91_17G078600 [Diphasiastrum complanatum]|uniref:Uncharacterized protein n=1 Tax=Diphasiastrum complanatum TaxID=34168 RepID=A0ACC2B8C7_DIPCM|nr:hypothetical protein O6H91_17G078600 [Diphasiastrum complanatum]